MIMTLDMDVTAERRHYKTHHSLSGSDATLLHTPRRQPRPFLIICGEAATTTLGLKGRQT